MNLNRIMLYLVCLVLVSCSTTVIKKEDIGHPTIVTAAPPKPVAAPMPAPAASKPVYSTSDVGVVYSGSTSGGSINKNNIYYKSFLFPKEELGDKFFNFIYFPRKPLTEKELNQYKFICKLWMDSFPKELEIKPYVDTTKDRLIPIYWLLTKQVKSEKCEDLIANYDYVRAQMYVNRNTLDKSKIKILGQYDSVIVSMNLSAIFKEEDLILAFDVWKNKLSAVPEKSSAVEIFGVVTSAKKVLGTLAGIMLSKFKG